MISMSGKNKQSKSNKVHTLVGDETEIRGDVIFDGGLFVDGTIIGNVEAKSGTASILNLSDKGSVEGQVRVPHIILNGTVIGDVYASERIELAAKARVTGNVYYNLIEMAIGAEINGQMVHEAEARNPMLSMPKKSPDKVATPRMTAAEESS
jgi:cytoskeletal protein CcmA (bactofilin family)